MKRETFLKSLALLPLGCVTSASIEDATKKVEAGAKYIFLVNPSKINLEEMINHPGLKGCTGAILRVRRCWWANEPAIQIFKVEHGEIEL